MSAFPPHALSSPIGASVDDRGICFRVWAPHAASVAVHIESPSPRTLALAPEDDGYWSVLDHRGRAGDRYGFVIDGGERWPDPATRFQPDGVDAASECIDPRAFAWNCHEWKRPSWRDHVIYELHVGAFTPAGTYRAAIERLDHIRELGATAIELMPLAEFAGSRNWGYDGVAPFAPSHRYGRPDDLRALVDEAHRRGLAVILDVVYNHLGPVGNYLPRYSPHYFHRKNSSAWGTSLNFDGAFSEPVRSYFLANAAHWLDDYRFDGLRLDATHAIEDRSRRHILAELTELAHQRGAFVIAENDRNDPALLAADNEPQDDRFDAVWADDFHHQLRVALTGTRASYFSSYEGTAESLADTLRHGWTYRGQPFPHWKNAPRGGECGSLPPEAFVYCIENHDQVGNRARGERLEHLVSAEKFRAATLLLCLSPYVPMLFMGQEWGSRSPFPFFTDHPGEVGRQVSAGRRKEFAAHGIDANAMADPQQPDTFFQAKLDWDACVKDAGSVFALTRAALAERRAHLGVRARARDHWRVAAVNGAVLVRYALSGGDRLLVFASRAWTRGNAPDAILDLAGGDHWEVVLDSNAVPPPRTRWSGRFEGPGAVWLAASKGTA